MPYGDIGQLLAGRGRGFCFILSRAPLTALVKASV